MKAIKKIILILNFSLQVLLLALTYYVLLNESLSKYLLQQAKGQITVLLNTKSISEILSDTAFPDSLKQKILLVQEIKNFAEDELGIKKSKNYNTFYNQNGKPILWMLTACNKFSFDEYNWEFPWLGKTSYKGFFDEKIANDEFYKLRNNGYDADISKVSAWSTLGILNDPILSSMLSHNEGELAELIIHELTHGTIYIKNDVTFNENLASFIGYKGAILFLKQKYKNNINQELDIYFRDIENEKKLKNFILLQKIILDSLYHTFNSKTLFKTKLVIKTKLLGHIASKTILQNFYNLSLRSKIAHRILNSGNAYFMSFVRYDSQFEIFEKEMKTKSKNNLKQYINYLKENYN